MSVARVLVWSVSVFIVCHSFKFCLCIIELTILVCYDTKGTIDKLCSSSALVCSSWSRSCYGVRPPTTSTHNNFA